MYVHAYVCGLLPAAIVQEIAAVTTDGPTNSQVFLTPQKLYMMTCLLQHYYDYYNYYNYYYYYYYYYYSVCVIPRARSIFYILLRTYINKFISERLCRVSIRKKKVSKLIKNGTS